MNRKVLIVASTFSHIVSFHLPYVERFHQLGWEVHIACGGEKREIPYADSLHSLPFEKSFLSISNFHASAMIRRLVLQEKYDLIITHTSLAAFFTRLALKEMRQRPKLINVVHGYLFDDETPTVKRFVLEVAELFTARQTDKILTMNAYDTAWAEKHKAAAVIRQIPGMGVDEDKLRASGKVDFGFSEDDFVLIYPAEFSERKNQRMLIEAISLLPEKVKLILPGTGDEFTRCMELAEKLNVKGRVVFPGFITDIQSALRAADAAVSASRSEGLPFNIVEAMLMSLPVVASRVKGHTDLVEDGVTGFLFSYDDIQAFTKAVKLLLDDEARRINMGSCGKQRAKQFTLDSVFQMVMDEYISSQ